jgi:site-specific recombinase XerD
MGRHAEGIRLFQKPGRDTWHVRFTHRGARVERSTGHADRGMATRRGEEIFAKVVSGGEVRARRSVGSAALISALERWYGDFTADHDARTAREYLYVARAQWMPRWSTVTDITTEAAIAYTRERLREAQRVSVRKELSALRVFLRWCHEKRIIPTVPDVPRPAVTVTGSISSPTRKRSANVFTPDEVERIIAELPETSRGRPVRDYVIALWDTGLRPVTLARLRPDVHYRAGERTLTVTREIDKGRYDRVLDLTPRARSALTRRCRAATRSHRANQPRS